MQLLSKQRPSDVEFQKLKTMLQYRNLAIILILLTLSASKSPDQQSFLHIQILNVEKDRGKIIVEIYKDKSDWLKSPFQKTTLATDEISKKASLKVPYGKYAVSIYQDVNENGKLDQNFLGIPKEPVGFGNNHKPLGKPDFESALIEHTLKSEPEAIKLFSVL
jgi:uncharacterized protein (DUF2141 family)